MEIAQMTTVLFTVLYILESLANIKLRRELEQRKLGQTIQVTRVEKVRLGKMSLIDKIKEWWNTPSWENELWNQYNELEMKLVQEMKERRETRQEKLKSYESMSGRQLLVEIAKNTLE